MPNSFSNRVATAAVSVILIDKLNTRIEDQLAVREQAIKFVQELKPSDRIGLYVLDETDNIRVLHDFSSDSSSLLRALARFRGRTSNAVATTEDVVDTSVSDEGLDPALLAWIQGVDRQREADLVRDRAAHTSYGFQTIARHLAGVRGRKNLIWISSAFPITVINNSGTLSSLASDLNPGLRALNEANVAMYPVDARRLIGAFAGRAADKMQTFTTLSNTGGNMDVMELVASETGGRAYYNTNDLTGSMRRAIDDSRVTYVLGFYPTHNKWDGKFHQLKVEVKRRGVDIRYRTGYAATPTPARDDARGKEALQLALASPLESTAVGLHVRLAKPAAPAPGSVDVVVRIDPATVTLEKNGERWSGQLDLLIIQAVPQGPAVVSMNTTLTLNLTVEQHDKLQREGLVITRTIPIQPAAHQLRVVGRDATNGAIGSVLIPGDKVRAAM
jgi:VWFA-related protein